MEHAPLRPVPSRRSGPVDPAAARREVEAALPALSPLDAHALALVALSERPRAEVSGTLGMEEVELGRALARARKELRRTVAVLGGSGWCERTEGLISDRLDGALAPADERRLDVHLRNCPRCVEHERRLVQATDWLLAGVPGGAPVAPVAPTAAPAPPPTEAPPPTAAPKEVAPAETPEPAVPEPAPEDVAAAAEVLVTVRTKRQIAAAVAWNSAIAIAVLLMLATIALTIAGILGAEL